MLAALKYSAAEIIFFVGKQVHHCIMHATQSTCCSKKVSISLFLSYGLENMFFLCFCVLPGSVDRNTILVRKKNKPPIDCSITKKCLCQEL